MKILIAPVDVNERSDVENTTTEQQARDNLVDYELWDLLDFVISCNDEEINLNNVWLTVI